MEVGYLELSQFSCNSHQFNYNFYSSPLGTIGFLTSGIKAIHLEAMVETKSTILLDEAISNFQEVQKNLASFLRNYLKHKQEDNNPKHLGPMRIIYQAML